VADRLDHTTVTRRALVGDDDTPYRVLLTAHSREPEPYRHDFLSAAESDLDTSRTSAPGCVAARTKSESLDGVGPGGGLRAPSAQRAPTQIAPGVSSRCRSPASSEIGDSYTLVPEDHQPRSPHRSPVAEATCLFTAAVFDANMRSYESAVSTAA
jgi:hypothetical protein